MSIKSLTDNKSFRKTIWGSIVILIIARLFLEWLVREKGYFLIHDSIYWIINYIIIMLSVFICNNNKHVKNIEYIVLIVFFILNTKGTIETTYDPLFFSSSPNNKNEIIIKETVDDKEGIIGIKRRYKIFGQINDRFITKDKYRTFSEGTYKINWLNNNIATITYLTGEGNKLEQHIYSFKKETPSSYSYVLPSLTGKWVDKDNHNNTLEVYMEKFIYKKDGKTYNYDIHRSKQKGYIALIMDGQGKAPDISIILNDDCTIGSDCLVNNDGTIFIGNVTLEDEDIHVYKKAYRK